MRRSSRCLLWAAYCSIAAVGQCEEQPPWRQPLSASSPTVIGLWRFDAPDALSDASGHGHKLKLRGQARIVGGGRFGGGLESFPAGAGNDKPQGAAAKNHPDLNPKGPFTLELWLKPKPEMAQQKTVFLVDKKYYHYAKDIPRANMGYCLFLRPAGGGKWRLVAYLGFGKDSAAYTSSAVELPAGQWHHIAFTYDGAGVGRLFLDGQSVGRARLKGRAAVTASVYDLVIGDRYGSTFAGCAAVIDEVRLSNGVVSSYAGRLEVSRGGRMAFVRMERGARVILRVYNDTGLAVEQTTLTGTLAGARQQVKLGNLPAAGEASVELDVDTSLRPGDYDLSVSLSARRGGRAVNSEETFRVSIVPRQPRRMPVVMWGHGDFETLTDIGFTHQLFSPVSYGYVLANPESAEAGDENFVAERIADLDEYLRHGVRAVAMLYPARWLGRRKEMRERYHRISRNGQPRKADSENLCGNFPELQQYCYRVGAAVAHSYGDHPALQAALIHTEVRGGTDLCFHPHDLKAFRDFAGYDIPSRVNARNGIRYQELPYRTAKRVVADDDRYLTFYRWFWSVGDGWNGLHSQVHRGLHTMNRKDFWTFYDPAVRVPSVWGSGGEVDVISQWTYSYPDPIKIGEAADELFAMASGSGQKVMKMTQIIWYRSGTAPELPKDESKRAQWEKDIPDARFITIAPDHLREALWCELARPVRGVMYHGWGSLVPATSGSYRFTNPETRPALTQLIRDVVRPLGPMLLDVPDPPTDVAMLESFTSQVFAGRGSWGWSGSWEADMHLILQWARLQPRIVYDQNILRDGLDGFRILVMPACDVLCDEVVSAVREFQRRGGLVVADEFLCPAISPDILIPLRKRTKKPDEDKRALQKMAAELRAQLAPFYQWYADSSDPDLVIRRRRFGEADYVFVINDRRTFGNYVGHHGLVMEKGLPAAGTVSIRRTGCVVYDLVSHRLVTSRSTDGRTDFEVQLGPGEGRVYLLTPSPVAQVSASGPAVVQHGAAADVSVVVQDAAGRPVGAVMPVEVRIVDGAGRAAELSGYYSAPGGKLAVTVGVGSNDALGIWQCHVRELASGREARCQWRVE